MEFNCLILRSKLNADNPSRASTSLQSNLMFSKMTNLPFSSDEF